MNEISFKGKLYCDKSMEKLPKTVVDGIKRELQDFLSLKSVQKAIPEDVYISTRKTKYNETLIVNIKDKDDTKFQTMIYKDGNNSHIAWDMLVYIVARHDTGPRDVIREFLEGIDYIYDRGFEILKKFS